MNPIEDDDDDFERRRPPAPPRWPAQTLPVAERFRKVNAFAAAKRPSGESRLDVIVNPLQQIQRVLVQLEDGKNTPLVLEWLPQEKHELDRFYRYAIWHRHPDTGVVIGGEAPLLQRIGKSIEVHPSLSQETIERDRRDEVVRRDANGHLKPTNGDFDV